MNKDELFKYWELSTLFEKVYKKYNIEKIKNIENKFTGAFCYIAKYDNIIYIIFKHTEFKFNDIITDLLFNKSTIWLLEKNIKFKVHTGFLFQYLSIREEIFKIINNFRNYQIIVLGHSLGAALSSLFISNLKYKNPKMNIKGYVFGSPRVGNLNFKIFFNNIVNKNNFINIQNKSDIICKLPLRIMGYFHVGQIIKIGKCGISIKNHNNYNKFLGEIK